MGIHPIDRLAGAAYRIPNRRSTIFPDGWGDPHGLALMGALDTLEAEAPAVEVEWGRKQEHRGFRRRRGWFASPASHLLPEPARAVPVEEIAPARGSARTVVILPAWNDHGFEERRKTAVLLAERGVASLSFDIPYYGARRTAPHGTQAIRSVADFARMGYGAVTEARGLLASIETPVVGVTGFSMGGNLAALTAASIAREVAAAPLAASHSPGPVYLDGVLRHAIAWGALGGRGEAATLRGVLSSASALSAPPLPHLRSAVVVGGTGDGFVPRSATHALAEHWGAELRMLPGGHATLLWRHRSLLVDAVVDAFDRFERTCQS